MFNHVKYKSEVKEKKKTKKNNSDPIDTFSRSTSLTSILNGRRLYCYGYGDTYWNSTTCLLLSRVLYLAYGFQILYWDIQYPQLCRSCFSITSFIVSRNSIRTLADTVRAVRVFSFPENLKTYKGIYCITSQRGFYCTKDIKRKLFMSCVSRG